jgi:hypothetical protein
MYPWGWTAILETRYCCRPRLKCDGTRAETRFRLSAKRTIPFNPLNAELNPIFHLLALLEAHPIFHISRIRIKSSGTSVQSTTGSRGVRISGSNAGYTMFRGSVKSTGYTLHSPVSPSLSLPCVTVCHDVSSGLYQPILICIIIQAYRRACPLERNACRPTHLMAVLCMKYVIYFWCLSFFVLRKSVCTAIRNFQMY